MPCRATWRLHSEAALGDRFCNNKRIRYLSVPVGGCNWLIRIISRAGRKVKPVRLRAKGAQLVHLLKELDFLCRWATYLAKTI